MSMQGKQAKIVSPTQERAILGSLASTRSPHRDRGLWLVSMQAGLRAKATASLTWAMVPEAHGPIAEALQVQHRASAPAAGQRWTQPAGHRPAPSGTARTGGWGRAVGAAAGA